MRWKEWVKVQADSWLLDNCNWLTFCIIIALLYYCFHSHYITLSGWLKQLLEKECEKKCWVVRFGFDSSVCLSFQVIRQSPRCHLLSPLLSLVLCVSVLFLISLSQVVSLSFSLCFPVPTWSSSDFCSLLKAFSNFSALSCFRSPFFILLSLVL